MLNQNLKKKFLSLFLYLILVCFQNFLSKYFPKTLTHPQTYTDTTRHTNPHRYSSFEEIISLFFFNENQFKTSINRKPNCSPTQSSNDNLP